LSKNEETATKIFLVVMDFCFFLSRNPKLLGRSQFGDKIKNMGRGVGISQGCDLGNICAKTREKSVNEN
jgi:hypothetical protein